MIDGTTAFKSSSAQKRAAQPLKKAKIEQFENFMGSLPNGDPRHVMGAITGAGSLGYTSPTERMCHQPSCVVAIENLYDAALMNQDWVRAVALAKMSHALPHLPTPIKPNPGESTAAFAARIAAAHSSAPAAEVLAAGAAGAAALERRGTPAFFSSLLTARLAAGPTRPPVFWKQ